MVHLINRFCDSDHSGQSEPNPIEDYIEILMDTCVQKLLTLDNIPDEVVQPAFGKS